MSDPAEIERLRKLLSDTNTYYAECIAEREELRAENAKLRAAVEEITEENRLVGLQMDRMADEIEKLRAALKLFQPYSIPKNAADTDDLPVLIGDLRAAAAALKETGE